MTDEKLIQLLEEAAGRVPDTPPPVGDLLRQGRVTVRRRRAAALAGGVAAVLVVAGGVALGSHGHTVTPVATSGPSTTPSNGTADRTQSVGKPQRSSSAGSGVPAQGESTGGMPAAPAGMRWVGLRRAMVAVPTSWPTRLDVACDDGQSSYVSLNVPDDRGHWFVASCVPQHLAPAPDAVRLTLAPAGSTRTSAFDCDQSVPPTCVATEVVGGVAITLTAHDDAAARTWRQISDSATSIPDGYVAVPWVRGTNRLGPDVADLSAAITAAGLRPDTTLASGPGPITTSPAPGTIVPVGQTVRILDGRAVSTLRPEGSAPSR